MRGNQLPAALKEFHVSVNKYINPIKEKRLPVGSLLHFIDNLDDLEILDELDDLDLYSSRLLDELLTVHDNYAIVVLIYLYTEEVIYSILH